MLKVHCEGRQGLVFQLSTRRLELMVEHLVNQLQFKWSPHDLRRRFVTIAQRTLKDLATVKRLVNHSVGGDVTMKHYLRLSVEDLREPMQAVEDSLSAMALAVIDQK